MTEVYVVNYSDNGNWFILGTSCFENHSIINAIYWNVFCKRTGIFCTFKIVSA